MATFRKTVFCEIDFINKLFEILENESFKSHDFQYLKYLTSLKTLLDCSLIKLYFNISNEEFSKLLNSNEKSYKKKKIKGNTASLKEQFFYDLNWKQENNLIHIHCISEFPTLESRDEVVLNSILLTTQSNEFCRNVALNFGITVFNIYPDNLEKYQLNDCGNAILSGTFSKWDEHITVNNYSNSMIIIDNYLLNDMSMLEENLRPILDSLLPSSLDTVTYHLTIIGRISENLGNNKRKDLPVEPRYNKVQDILKSIRPELEIELSVIKTQSDFHDRTIILNNLWFGCGSGFNLFRNGKAIHSTTFNIVSPFLNDSQNWCTTAYSNIIHDVETLLKITPSFENNSYPCFFMGSKNNRLIYSKSK